MDNNALETAVMELKRQNQRLVNQLNAVLDRLEACEMIVEASKKHMVEIVAQHIGN